MVLCFSYLLLLKGCDQMVSSLIGAVYHLVYHNDLLLVHCILLMRFPALWRIPRSKFLLMMWLYKTIETGEDCEGLQTDFIVVTSDN